MATPHDALFKAFFSEPAHAVDVLRSALSAEAAACIDWSSLELASGSYVDEELRERQSDLLFRARTSDGDVLLHVLFEHQSREDAWMVFRMLRYAVRIWERELADGAHVLAPVVPVVLHHSTRGWRAPRRLSERMIAPPGLAAFVPGFEIVVDDVSRLSDEELTRRLRHASAQLVLRLFRDGRATDDPAAWLLGARRLIEDVARSRSDREVLWLMIRYLWEVARVDDPAPFLDAVRLTMGDPMKERASTLAEAVHQRGLQQGLREGIEQGIEQGRRRGLVSSLLELLDEKFGAPDDETRARVEGASDDELTRWTRRVLRARTLEEVFVDDV